MRDFHFRALSLLAVLATPTVALAEECDATSQGDSASPLKAELDQEASSAYGLELLQRDMKRNEAIKPAEKAKKGPLTSWRRAPLSLASTELNATDAKPTLKGPPYDCDKFPFFCDPRVNCPGMSEDDKYKFNYKYATDDGHANLQSWCLAYPEYGETIPMCVFATADRNLYAKMMYEEQLGAGATEIDALYCFGSGLCDSTKVTVNTTVAEAEEICTEVYGDDWKHIGGDDFSGALARGFTVDREAYEKGEKLDKTLATIWRETSVLAMTACAMGNYQCDAIYCKVNYCENEGYKKEYGFAAQAPRNAKANV